MTCQVESIPSYARDCQAQLFPNLLRNITMIITFTIAIFLAVSSITIITRILLTTISIYNHYDWHYFSSPRLARQLIVDLGIAQGLQDEVHL